MSTFKVPRGAVFWWIAATFWFVCWHLLMYRNIWANPTRLIQGPIGDNLVMLWNLGWVRHALSQGTTGLWFNNAFYPEGFLFVFSTHTWLDGLLFWTFSFLLPRGLDGVVLWYNAVQLLASVGTGLGAIATLSCWGVRHRPLLLLGASVITFCWFRSYASIGHQHFYGTQWVMFALLAGSWSRCFLRVGFFKWGLSCGTAAGLFLGLTFLNDQTHAVFGILLLGVILISAIFTRRRSTLFQCTVTAGVAAGIFLLVAAIHLVPLVQAMSSGRFTYSVPGLHVVRTVDATSIFLPNDRHGLLGDLMMRIRQTHNYRVEEGSYIGTVTYLLLFAAFAGSLTSIRRAAKGGYNPWRITYWATGAGCIFLIFALGEVLQVGNQTIIHLPGRMLREIPVLNNIRLPQRWVWPALLCIVLAGTLVLQLHWRRSGFARAAIIIALAAFAANEGKWHPLTEPVDTDNSWLNPPGLSDSIRRNWKSDGVLVLPVQYHGRLATAHSNYLQLITGFDIPFTLQYVARPPFDVNLAPVNSPTWTAETAEWLRLRKVRMVVFVYEEGDAPDWRNWIQQAKTAIPALEVLNSRGVLL